MNAKFFDVKKEKQDSIINAALKVFSVKGYKDASTDVIVKEAGISKGLLFHYFTSKQGLFDFVCDYSSKYMTLELTRSVKRNAKDFFEVMTQISQGRIRVMKNYPYMHQFLRNLRHETDPEALEVLGQSIEDMDTTYKNIYSQIDANMLVEPNALSKLINILDWSNDGFLNDNFNDNIDPDVLYEEYAEYLTLLRTHFYKSSNNVKVSIAKEEFNERNEAIMNEMKMEMTFEERLEAGKKPLVELSEEELSENDASDEENVEGSDDAEDSEKSAKIADEVAEVINKTATYGAPILTPSTSSFLSTAGAAAQSIDDIYKEAEENIKSSEEEASESKQ